ncbi:Leucyl aminopeptidase (aminopeptidase T) [Pilibacter termitis]|uniref:Leucyl aminopeptidase (Aminopeptidase T) n=1 Tax=Pilibacter termitis TaxID=263852 RepID=A0A1T4MTR3_9ENTE|nr:aminopeptidase [Pilibacter termitis]SJZ70291.1 Leucyl aminopeptidase (aminopeptidase T) [Pilibacter termitis]
MTLPNFEENLQKYARLIAEIGVGTKKGHTVALNISVDQAPLARLITKEAYALGASEVILMWADEEINREFLLHADEDRIENVANWKLTLQDEIIERGASRISVVSSDPAALAGVDSKRIATLQTAMGKAMMPTRIATQSNQLSWTVVAAASAGWAKKVFPELSEENAVDELWNQIFKTTRIYEEDPVAAWFAHDKKLQEKAEELNREQFDALHYTAEGTDIIFGLPKNHHWEGAGSTNARGEVFMANMPTEEVFTAPDANRVDGVVSSTRPLSYAGTIIDGMKFTFKNGRVVDFSAEVGEEVLAQLLDTDEGARHLGEIALVPDPSPISQSGITFFNTLFDENASNHVALGSAYAFSLEGGVDMSEEELKQAGLNRSNVHVDFMIGSDKMNIDGIRTDGTRVPVFRNGDWA